MSQTHADDPAHAEISLDVAKPSQQIQFLGFVEGLNESGNDLTGVFDWSCPDCGNRNKDITIIRPQQAFLARWSCGMCAKVTFIRFLARATAEWMAQHALVSTGKAHDGRGDRSPASPHMVAGARPVKRRRQGLFGWISIPALIIVILMALMDLERPHQSSASSHDSQQGRSASTPSARLHGYWLSQQADHMLCFEHIDPHSRRGSYVRVSRSGQKDGRVAFQVVSEEALGEELVIREFRQAGESGADATPPVPAPEVTLFVPKHQPSMIRMDIQGASPIVTAYRRVDDGQAF